MKWINKLITERLLDLKSYIDFRKNFSLLDSKEYEIEYEELSNELEKFKKHFPECD